MSKRFFPILSLLLVLCCSLSFAAQTKSVDAEGHQWWQHAVFYEIYPRSYADSNNDGVGDLKGITSRMAYLHDLGVDAIWISPCFPSPQVDFGYDVSDYENIDPMYGTLADFDQMVAEGKNHHVSIILDFVVNHTSDQHAWFLDSRSSRTAPHRDWYIWRDGKGPGQPPNNWISTFGGSAWKFDPTTNQYYYHYFYAAQPDLNWRNPAVEKAMLDTTRWWYKRGVSGFRLDAVDTMFEDSALHDNRVLEGKNSQGDPNTDEKYNKKLPEMHVVLQKLRTVADEAGAVLIGETWTSNIDELKEYYGPNGNELQMPMDFMFTGVNKLSPPEFRRQIAQVDTAGGWPVFVISNHDIVRSYNRYGDGKNNDAIAKLMGAFYLTLRGTPIMYYGEEIGMENNDPKRKEDVKDPIGRTGWPQEIGRDGERTPMQWNTGVNAGFSKKEPWLPVPPSYKTHNVATESKDPNSVFSMYKKVLALRHTNEALLEGNYTALNEDDANVMSYLRSYKGKAVLVALNMSSSPQKVKFDLTGLGFRFHQLAPLVTTSQTSAKGLEVTLEPFGVFIGDVKNLDLPGVVVDRY
ncbi:MAG: alpha-glucosidase [Acidobacteriales bacterium]|nr:alpha-glucosidase [Candidatus Koribacter versatilis]MBI3645650.1 alpha-glucosidase [Terriglobales bacterium]